MPPKPRRLDQREARQESGKPWEILVNKEFIVTRVANGFMLRLPHADPATQPDPEKTIHVFTTPVTLANFVQAWAQSTLPVRPEDNVARSAPGPSYTD